MRGKKNTSTEVTPKVEKMDFTKPYGQVLGTNRYIQNEKEYDHKGFLIQPKVEQK